MSIIYTVIVINIFFGWALRWGPPRFANDNWKKRCLIMTFLFDSSIVFIVFV